MARQLGLSPGQKNMLCIMIPAGHGAVCWTEAENGPAARPIPGAENTLCIMIPAGHGTVY
ncbi:MAG: hypothetical protein KH149_01030 [Clostridiales bacterium]|nr:hypothetical protein [Clostridiales bacterium]